MSCGLPKIGSFSSNLSEKVEQGLQLLFRRVLKQVCYEKAYKVPCQKFRSAAAKIVHQGLLTRSGVLSLTRDEKFSIS